MLQLTKSPAWDDPILLPKSEGKWIKQYRLLQSWYRETVIGAPPGKYGNYFQKSWLEDHPDANYLTPEVVEYVKQRVPEVKAEGGTLEPNRLKSNLLSSMPLCFNLFGHLNAHRVVAAKVMSLAFGLDIATVENIRVEWSPDRAVHLDDRTAFDAYVEYRTHDGKRGFVGVETKYTETFSPKVYDQDSYRRVTNRLGSGFRPGAADALKAKPTNQLWRNALLVVSLRQVEQFDYGHVAVVTCENDPVLPKAVLRFEGQLTDPPSLLRKVSYEKIIDAAGQHPELSDWAARFRKRYLDLSPVQKG